MQWLPCRPRTSWANLWFLSASRHLQVNHRPNPTHHHTSNQPKSQHCKLQVIHCRFCSGTLWHHYTVSPPRSRKSSRWWWQHQNRSCQDAEGVWVLERLNERHPGCCRDQWVYARILCHVPIFTSMFMVLGHIKSLSSSAGVIELFSMLADTLISLH